MSRMDFRGVVEGPRSGAAWLMALVSSTTLWLTEQIPLWIILVQILALGFSYATRHLPPAFRSSPIWLNLFMLGITTITIRAALAGHPATISLAYFTSLALGLQLMDARPRKSEFVLVALALFQVILASNLTDSVFFLPLVLVFLISVTWTLMLHTLAIEANEAGLPQVTSPGMNSDLRRVTTVATIASLFLGALIFTSLPRVKTSFLRGGSHSGLALAGFSQHVSLGQVGQIRSDPTVVMRIEAINGDLPKPSEAYWRGLAFDQFDGKGWSVTRFNNEQQRKTVSGVGRFGIQLRPLDPEGEPTQRILREPVDGGVLFTPGHAQAIQGPFQNLERDRNGSLYLSERKQERMRYTVTARPSLRDAERLRQDRLAIPETMRLGGPQPDLRYVQLPELDPEVKRKARRIMSGQASDFERMLALRNHLRENGRYTDAPPALGDDQTCTKKAAQ